MTEVHCSGCGKYMGTIEKASLRVGWTIYCVVCHGKIDLQPPPKDHGTFDFPEIFNDLFNLKKPKW